MRAALLLLALGFAACDSGPVACTEEAVAGLVVDVQSAATGAPILDATVMAQSEAYSETLASHLSGTYAGAYERPGTYTVRAEAPGFRAAAQSGVEVRANVCHVETVALTLQLRPE